MTFIAMELIRGDKLSDLLAKEKLTVARALEIAIEIGEGLSRAHERGIVHRNLKPANIMITYDGHVKFIDFGLAKLMERAMPEDSDVAAAVRGGTASGVVMGTPCPRSKLEVSRSIIEATFSASESFLRDTDRFDPLQKGERVETLNAIINTPAPPLEDSVDAALTPPLQRVLDGSLAKDATDRYPEMKALLSDLRLAKRDSDSRGSGAKPWRGPRQARALLTPRRSWALPLAIGAAAATIGIYVYSVREPPPPRLSGPVQVTLALGVEDFPTWSPDGRSIAYAASETGVFRGGNWDIMITQVGGGEPLNRTADGTYRRRGSFPLLGAGRPMERRSRRYFHRIATAVGSPAPADPSWSPREIPSRSDRSSGLVAPLTDEDGGRIANL